MQAKQTLVKNGRYHVAIFRKEKNLISCEIEQSLLTYPGGNFSKALGCFEYLHPLTFLESSEIRQKYPETINFSLQEIAEFLNNLPKGQDPYPSVHEILN